MPDTAYKTSPDASRATDQTGPLLDWLSTISRRDAHLDKSAPRRSAENAQDEERRVVEMPRLRQALREPAPQPDEAAHGGEHDAARQAAD